MQEDKKFALTLFLLPWIPAFVLYKHSLVSVAMGVIVGFLLISLICFLCKKIALKLKSVLSKIGSFLGKYIAIVVLAICYIVAVIPTGLLMKIVKRDRLRLKKPEVNSYWLNCETKNTDYEYQF